MPTDKELLLEANYRFYTGLLPTGLRPNVGGTADGIVKTIAGFVSDLELELIKIVARTTVDEATDEELNKIGDARLLKRFPNESTEQFRVRVKGAYEFWSKGGTVEGMRVALSQLGYRSSIIERDPGNWSGFRVTIYPETRTYDGTAAELNRVLTIINDVKPAHTVLLQLTYIASGNAYGTGVTFGSGAKWGGVSSILYTRP
jgi:Phage tail protein (Tail_P2_I)